jgi:hypothetical protein
MSCEKCEEEQELHTDGNGFYYRWKNANLLFCGCREHVGELIKYLNKKQDEDEE